MPCPQDAKSAAIRGQNDLARTKVRAAIILTSYFCAFGTIPDPVYEFTAWDSKSIKRPKLSKGNRVCRINPMQA